jgi:hypothetical protein
MERKEITCQTQKRYLSNLNIYIQIYIYLKKINKKDRSNGLDGLDGMS